MKLSMSYTKIFNKVVLKNKTVSPLICFFTFFASYNYSEYQSNKIMAWAEENFKQADKHDHDYVKRAQKFIKNLKVYNKLSMIASFDIMLLTDEARKLYVDYHGKIQGLSFDEIQTLYSRQVNENKYFVSAYVIAWHNEFTYETSKSLFTGEYHKNNNILKGDDAMWNVSLILGGRRYLPETIKIVEMPTEYQKLFGPCCNQFATTYLVRFAAKDKFNNYIFTDQQVSPILRFSSPTYKIDAIWKNITMYGAIN